MSHCEEIKELLWDYDEEADGEQNIMIREHLLSCEDCAKEYEEIKEIKSGLSEIDEPVPEELRTGVMNLVRKGNKKKKPYIPFGTIAAAAVIVIVFFVSKFASSDVNGMAKDASLSDEMDYNIVAAECAESNGSGGEAEAMPDSPSETVAEKADKDNLVTNESVFSVDWFGVVDSLKIRTVINRIYLAEDPIESENLETLTSESGYTVYLLTKEQELSEITENSKKLTRNDAELGSAVLIAKNK